MPKALARWLQEEVEAGDPVAIARLITDHASDAIFLLDEEGRTTFVNPAGVELFGWEPDELVGFKLHDMVHYQHPDGTAFPMSECPLGRVFQTGVRLRLHEDLFFSRDGQEVPVACSNAPIVKDGVVRGGVLIVRDITERRTAERHKQLLLDELNHRVKNMLTVVQAIAEQSLKGTEYASARKALAGRLGALADAQSVLMQGDGVVASMHATVRRALHAFVSEDRVQIQGPEVALRPRLATAMTMALHELATNAVKYGALSCEDGSLSITWHIAGSNGGSELNIVWQECGGPPVVPPVRRGFGSRMIEKLLTKETGGSSSLKFPPEGLLATFRVPLD